MRPASLTAAVAAALASTSALAAPPTTPSDLRVDVYSGTAAELFWGRSSDPDGAVSRYEIRRDGMLVDTRDGLSYFTDDLRDGRAFAFTVTAVDFDGERSTPAAVSVVGGDRGGAVGSGGGRPAPPANLTSSVYSSNAAEVFWDRNGQQGLSYEVSVDGGQVVTTDGTSAFLSGLDGARGRGVDVVAIDAKGRRSGAANVTLGGGSGGGNPTEPVNGNAPPAPSNLRGELYSSNSGEVFWSRVSGTRLSYEVSLDGDVVSTTTGTSYYADNVPGIDGKRVDVVAIGPDGTRSSAASTTIGSGGASNPDPDPDHDPGTDAPPAPANARIEVYSGTAAELFFDRAASSANIVETEISRDGMLIGSTNGTSFFDDTRADGTDYRYVLVAIDARGERSAPTTIGRTDGDADPEGPSSGSPGDEAGNPMPGGFDLLAVGQGLVRTLAGYQLDQLAVVVDDLAFIAGQTTTIVWPDGDYYQVQNATTFAEVCNGGPTCPVVPGSYVVINQTSGERSPLEVPYVDPADQVEAVALPASGFPVEAVGGGGAEDLSVDRIRYGCENDGSVVVASGTATVALDAFRDRREVQLRGYVFDRCRITVRDGLLPDGGYRVQGALYTLGTGPFAFANYADGYDYDALSIVGDDGLEYRVDGRLERSIDEGSITTGRRTATIEEYAKVLPGGRLAESIVDGRYAWEYVDEQGPFVFRQTLDADGTVRGTLSAGQRVTIVTEPVLFRQLVLARDVDADTVPVPFKGTIELLAEDGSFLQVNANPLVADPTRTFAPALVDLAYTAATGRQERVNQAELIDLPVAAPNCAFPTAGPSDPVRSEVTGRLECRNDGRVIAVP